MNTDWFCSSKTACTNKTASDVSLMTFPFQRVKNWEQILKKRTQFRNIIISNSENVRIGNITHINGPLYINYYVPNYSECTENDPLPVVSRRIWLARPPTDCDDLTPMPNPAKFVIISHSASQEAYNTAANCDIVRLIQKFHMAGRKWNDIGYNFLIGADGTVYEGRGWRTVGAHCFGYNRISIGICFIGYFVTKSPTFKAMGAALDLIEHGVQIGAVDPDYFVLAHRQCSRTESPGFKFYEEIQSWKRWNPEISIHNPSSLSRTV